MGSKIWVAGTGFDIEARCVRWDERGGFNAHQPHCVDPPRPRQTCADHGVTPWSPQAKNTRPNRFGIRPRMLGHEHDLAAAQAAVTQLVLHLDGCPDAEACFNTLHNERGLSCHFILDNDGTLYQTLDLVYMGYHAAGANAASIGVEMSNRGDAKKFPGYYRSKRDVTTCNIHGHTYLAYDFTEAQYATMRALALALGRALPNIPLEYPQESPGRQSWALFEKWKAYQGYLGHYHTTTRKWDPGPFDFKKFLESLRGKRCFPIAVSKGKPEVPEDSEERGKQVKRLYALNEEAAQGGYFPVGPWGETKVWHGGVHLEAELRAPVFAPFPGRLVAARNRARSTPVGSVNFVLLRHDLSVGAIPVRFWSLYYHLAHERGEGVGTPAWVASDGAKAQRTDDLMLLDEPVAAGDVIGHVGVAGPDARRPQIHFEIFARTEVGNAIEPNRWQVVDGTSGGRYCDLEEINRELDTTPRDGKLSRRELTAFYSRDSVERRTFRRLAVLSYSEWTAAPDWNGALRSVPDFQGQTQAQVDRIVADQIAPTLWWTPAVAAHARLQRSGVVYHYHPITFVDFINEKLLEAKLLGDNGPGTFAAGSAVVTTDVGVTDDREDESGDSFVTQSELDDPPEPPEPDIENLEEGFPD